MNNFIVALSCLAAIVSANPTQDVIVAFTSNGRATCRSNCRSANPLNCPPSNCPPPVRDGFCGEIDCSHPGNRVVLHPTVDPNYYFQCSPVDSLGNWRAIRMPCGCRTLFSTRFNRCVHRHEWVQDCPNQPLNPIYRDCTEECLTCDPNPPVNVPPPTWPPATLPPVGTPPATLPPVGTPPPDNCACPCVPCIWWPCMPCMPVCPCQNNNNNNNRPTPPQNPWQPTPQNPWQPTPQNPWQPTPQNPWQPGPQIPWEPTPQNPWQEPTPQNPWNRPQQG